MRNQVRQLISESLKEITDDFFSVKTTYSQSGITRERVFCYELYHQMRLNQTKYSKIAVLSLNAEIDKSGHEEFEDNDMKNPDFILHIPGNMNNNMAVIEVKGVINKSKILKDFETLIIFTKKYNYQLGIFILYNNNIDRLRNILDEVLHKYVIDLAKIDIITIQQAKNECKIYEYKDNNYTLVS